jgi:glycosyltransferase involved in cell wall biosynthesis
MEGVGLIRAMKFAKYLPEYGWEPIVLTVGLSGETGFDVSGSAKMKVFRTPYKDVVGTMRGCLRDLMFWRRNDRPSAERLQGSFAQMPKAANPVASIVKGFITIPDEQAGWYRFGAAAGAKLVNEEKIDLIFSTSPPETAHLIARSLKLRHKVPWFADMRDLWVDDHYRKRTFFKKGILRFLERKVLQDADLVITVSRPWADRIAESMNGQKKVVVIENGFDDEDFKDMAYTRNDKFTISYTGKLNREHQKMHIFLKALSGLLADNRIDRSKLLVKFYLTGYDRPDIKGLARTYDIADVIEEPPTVRYKKSLEAQRSSDALLLIQWQGVGKDGWYSSKVYDYLGARRPILALAEKGSVIERLINDTASGLVADDPETIQYAVLAMYDEYIKNGYVAYAGKEDRILKCTRRRRAEELAALFDSACGRKPA